MNNFSRNDTVLKAILFVLILIALMIVGLMVWLIYDPVQELVENRRPSPTFVPTSRPTRTPTPTMLPTPGPSPTAGPSMTPTPGPGPTATPTVMPTMTSIPPGGHEVTQWHAPMLHHDHGANPADAHPMLRLAMEQYWTQDIGSVWLSGPMENMFPEGMHAAFTNLMESDTNCPQFANLFIPGPEDLCINAYFVQVHAAGSNEHGRVDVHSYKGVFLVCDGPQVAATCGVIVTGGWHDYLFQHSPYKKYLCYLEGDPLVTTGNQFQAPYVGLAVDANKGGTNAHRIFWNSQGGSGTLADEIFAARGYLPNRMTELAWSEMDAWDQAVGYTQDCVDSTKDLRVCPDDSTNATCENNGTAFQLFTIRIENLPDERPFSGYTDRHGIVRPAGVCTTESLDCVPLIITAEVPVGRPFFNRVVSPLTAPVQDFDNGMPMRMPPFSLGN